jgi:hypothetical protein
VIDNSSSQQVGATPNLSERAPRRRTAESTPGCIKLIILGVLLALLASEIAGAFQFARLGDRISVAQQSGDFGRFAGDNWLLGLMILITLFLIALIIFLIQVQRILNCNIAYPTAGLCAVEDINPTTQRRSITVKGTASGTVFGHYTLAVSSADLGPLPGGVITYPHATTIPVSGAAGDDVLGMFDSTIYDGGGYTITLTVYPAGAGSSISCSVTFSLLKVAVAISHVAGIAASVGGIANPFDPNAQLVSGGAIKSVGGAMHIKGAAEIFGCSTRKIKDYTIRPHQLTSLAAVPADPATNAPIPPEWAAAIDLSPLPLQYTSPDQYNFFTIVRPVTDLLNSLYDWQPFGPPGMWKLQPTTWNSVGLNGRYRFLLMAEDTLGNRYYDTQIAWLDNQDISPFVHIVKYEGHNVHNGLWEPIQPCEDVHMSDYDKLRIVGLAWDRLIDPTLAAVVPNDNFGSYSLSFWKGILVTADSIPNAVAGRVPAFTDHDPTPADADVLGVWDLTLLDPATPSPYNAANQLARGDSCTFTIELFATDTTLVNEGDTHHSYAWGSLKIINDR